MSVEAAHPVVADGSDQLLLFFSKFDLVSFLFIAVLFNLTLQINTNFRIKQTKEQNKITKIRISLYWLLHCAGVDSPRVQNY